MKDKKSRNCVLYMSTFPPRECGIATFTKDLVDSMDKKFNPALKSEVLAINDNGSSIYNYDGKVSFQLDQTDMEGYTSIAEEINGRKDIKIVNVQHEFGIFGGNAGDHLLPFLEKVKKPIVVTFHSVVPAPDECKKRVVEHIFRKASAVVVMAKESVRILKEDYEVNDSKKIFFVPHGVPQVPFNSKNSKEKVRLENRIVLSTFGLMNRGKGIEYVIESLPQIVKNFPEIIYLVIGETHPQVRKMEGESYRNSLVKLVEELGLRDNVRFYNKYLALAEIIAYLNATDIYISPSLDENQIVSGTLSYALGCGKAIISTSTAYAKEVLAKNRGILVDFRNPETIGNAIFTLLSDSKLREEMEKNAYELGRKMIWPNVAAEYLGVFNKVVNLREDTIKKFPALKLSHLASLTDNVGVIHHAKHSVPNRKTGYTLDDNTRALIAAVKHYNIFKSQKSLELIKTYLSFLHYAQKEDGTFHNLLDYERKFLDEEGSEDSYGRALMASGFVVSSNVPENIKATAKFIFDNAVRSVYKLRFLRAKAFSIIGLYYYFRKYKHDDIVEKVKALADSLADAYRENSANEWKWFEPYLTYSNGKLPESLFFAYSITKDKKYLEIAEESLDFLSKTLIVDGKMVLIGNKGWYRKEGERAFYDQQPVDAASMVQSFLTAYSLTKKKIYYSNAVLAFNWFLGKNSLNQMIYDEITGGCFDGLSENTINLNQGAESTISYLLARLSLEEIGRV